MYDNLNISAIQLDSALGDIAANLEYASLAIRQLPDNTDVAVLPELFSTGYISNRERAASLAQTVDEETIIMLCSLSKERNCAIAGSFLAKDNDKLYNRAFFIEPSGEKTFYDKRHLFNLSKEAEIVEAGKKRPAIVRFRGWNLALAICYDVRFPVWLRNNALSYDALLVPANWPDRRAFAWEHLLQARAIENQAYVVGANRSGHDDFGIYDDLTFVFDYMGQSIGKKQGILVNATLNLSALRKVRSVFPVWKDADIFDTKE